MKLGGYVILPRALDKGRATIAGLNGDYNYACPLDERFFKFTEIDAQALHKELAAGKGDGEILQWINENSRRKPGLIEVLAWSAYQEQRCPTDVESRQFFNELHSKAGANREDIMTWFDLLDLDDHVSFGGKA